MALVCPSLAACGQALQSARPSAPLQNDPDRVLFRGPPEEYHSPRLTDAFDKLALRPLTRVFAVDSTSEAGNLNTLDEVADSSWFTNRIGQRPMTPLDVASGPCVTPPLGDSAPWIVKSSKPDGATPGFVIEGSDHKRYLLKFDGELQGPHDSAADAIVSRIYYAAGYSVPCNRVVFFERSQLRVAPDAQETDWLGNKTSYGESDLDASLRHAPRTLDGRYRALASLWLDGKGLGPWRFESTRGDDPNDIVPHEDRRELRGMRLLAAWTGHSDQREQNTLDTWMEVANGWGFVRHNVIDFGDCIGHSPDPPMLGRRLAGHSYGLDLGQIAADFATFGVITRPFELERFGASGRVFGYYNVQLFDPEQWRPSYPNPAFGRMTERDAAWMARILAHFRPEHLERAIRAGRLGQKALNDELLRIMLGRRDRILRRYLFRLSPLANPTLSPRGNDGLELCLDDLALRAGLAGPGDTTYAARLEVAAGPGTALPTLARGTRRCVDLGRASVTGRSEVTVQLAARHAGVPTEGGVLVRLAEVQGAPTVVGLERQP